MFYTVLYCCLKTFLNVNLLQTPNFLINFRLIEPFLRTLLTHADTDSPNVVHHIYPDTDVPILLRRRGIATLEDSEHWSILLSHKPAYTIDIKYVWKHNTYFLTHKIVAVWLKRNYMGKQASVIDRSTCHLTPVVKLDECELLI